MPVSIPVSIAVVFVLSMILVGYTFYHNKRITCMTGMMIAMTLGMMCGLIVGVAAGVLYSGNLFKSTIVGMITGLAIGFLAGIPVSVMAVLDGVLSGIMGGMMGAMLGDMIASEYKLTLIKVMFVLFVNITLILFYMMQQEVGMTKERNGRGFLKNPLFIAATLGVFYFGYNRLASNVLLPNGEIKDEIAQKGNMDPGSTITIQAGEFSYSPNTIKAAVNEKVTLVLENKGQQEHDLEIVGLNATILKQRQGHDSHQPDNDTVHLHSKTGESEKITFVPLKKGTYQIVCTVPGHKEAGMKALIKVV